MSTSRQRIKEIIALTKPIGGWLSAQEGVFLFKLASRLPAGAVIVEIGSYKGKSTIWLASGISNQPESLVYAIDPHKGSSERKGEYGKINTLPEFMNNVKKAGLGNFVQPIACESEKAAKSFDKKIDLLFIDGSHTFEAAKNDFVLWSQRLKPDGWVVMHDATVLSGPWKVAKKYIFLSREYRDTGMLGSMVFGRHVPLGNLFDQIIGLGKNFFSYLFTMSYVKMRSLPLPRSWRRRASRANFKHKVRIV